MDWQQILRDAFSVQGLDDTEADKGIKWCIEKLKIKSLHDFYDIRLFVTKWRLMAGEIQTRQKKYAECLGRESQWAKDKGRLKTELHLFYKNIGVKPPEFRKVVNPIIGEKQKEQNRQKGLKGLGL